MPVYNGNVKQKDLYVGGVKIKEAYYGDIKVYSAGYPAGTVLFDSSTAGTYTVTLKYTQNYKLWLVGGGSPNVKKTWCAGGACEDTWAGGGSGAMIYGTAKLNKGTYTIVIGGSNANSTFYNQIAGHGVQGTTWATGANPGTPGTATITLSGLQSKTTNDASKAVKNTFWGWQTDDHIGLGASSPYNNSRSGPGAGGGAWGSAAGHAGMFRLESA